MTLRRSIGIVLTVLGFIWLVFQILIFFLMSNMDLAGYAKQPLLYGSQFFLVNLPFFIGIFLVLKK